VFYRLLHRDLSAAGVLLVLGVLLLLALLFLLRALVLLIIAAMLATAVLGAGRLIGSGLAAPVTVVMVAAYLVFDAPRLRRFADFATPATWHEHMHHTFAGLLGVVGGAERVAERGGRVRVTTAARRRRWSRQTVTVRCVGVRQEHQSRDLLQEHVRAGWKIGDAGQTSLRSGTEQMARSRRG
jgi:membrane protein implicated in regulation of membrane protease activity